MSHYYFAASLPALVLAEFMNGAPLPVEIEDFRFSAKGVLTDDELAELDAALALTPWLGRSRFAEEYGEVESQIRADLARTRIERACRPGQSCEVEEGSFSASLEKEIEAALAAPNPLEVEAALDRIRWRRLEELADRRPYSLDAVLAWASRLAIAARWSAMGVEAGWIRLEEYARAAMEAFGAEAIEGGAHG